MLQICIAFLSGILVGTLGWILYNAYILRNLVSALDALVTATNVLVNDRLTKSLEELLGDSDD